MNTININSTGATNAILKLSELGIIKVTGPDAASFLHGQLSNDILHMQMQEARLAAYCSPQGRMLASFIVVKTAPEEYLLICAADLLEITLKRLSMFVMRAKVQLSNANGELSLYGFIYTVVFDGNPLKPLEVRGEAYDLSIGLTEVANIQRLLLLIPDGHAVPDLPELPTETWAYLEVQSGIAHVSNAIREKYIPQMLNYESIGAVNFKKGCYPGQEVVSRSQFRGTLKRRLSLIQSESPIHVGDEVYTATAENSEPIGEVVTCAITPKKQWCALAVLRTDALDKPLALSSPQGCAVKLEPLPYPLKDDF